MTRHLARSFLALMLAAIPLPFLLTGCGGSDTRSLVPEPSNPFTGYAVGGDATFEVATWNLHNFADDAGTDEVDLVAQAIMAMGCDVVALQEIADGIRFTQLLERLPGWDGHVAQSDGYQNLGFVWLDSTVTRRAVGDLHLPIDNDWRPFPRLPLVLEITWNGRDLALINNHFKCCGDGTLDRDDDGDEENRRWVASQLLEAHLASAYPGQAALVVGDLNDRLNDSAADNVFTPFLDQPEAYRFADMALATGSSRNFSYGPGSSHLDHILVNARLFTALDASTSRCVTLRLDQALDSGKYRDDISDHVPVVLVLTAW